MNTSRLARCLKHIPIGVPFAIMFSFSALAESGVIPTEQDNLFITSMRQAEAPILFVPAGIHIYMIEEINQNFVRQVLNLPEGATLAELYGRPDTDLVCSGIHGAVGSVRIYRITGAPGIRSLSLIQEVMAPASTTQVTPRGVSSDGTRVVVQTQPSIGGTTFYLCGVGMGPSPISGDSCSMGLDGPLSWTQSNSVTTIRRYSLADGSLTTERNTPGIPVGESTEGLWVADSVSASVTLWGGSSLANVRSISLPGIQVTNARKLPTEEVVISGFSGDGGIDLFRFSSSNQLISHRVGIGGMVSSFSPDGAFGAGPAILVEMTTGNVMSLGHFSDQPSVGVAWLRRANGSFALFRADFWADGLEWTDASEYGPWQQPSAMLIRSASSVVFDGQLPGATAQLTTEWIYPTAPPWGTTLATLVASNSILETLPFSTASTALFSPGVTTQLSVTFSPTAEGVYSGALRIQLPGTHGSGNFEAAALLARSGSPYQVSPAMQLKFAQWGKASLNYFLDSASTHALGSCSWHGENSSLSAAQNRVLGAYLNPAEAGLRLQSLAAAARLGWISPEVAWAEISRSLAAWEQLMARTEMFPDEVLRRFYVLRGPDGVDRTIPEITADPDPPSSDDNALFCGSLGIVASMAIEASQFETALKADTLRRRIDLRRFLRPDGSISHYRITGADGQFSTSIWDRASAEGGAILVIMAEMGALSRAEFEVAATYLLHPASVWQGVLVPDANFHSVLFTAMTRGQAGLPVAPDEAPGATFVAHLRSLTEAHLAAAQSRGWTGLVSHFMTGTVGGVPQIGKGPGNESGLLGAAELQQMTGTHGLFVPFSQADWMGASISNDLFSRILALEDDYFHDLPGRRGWEAAVPLFAGSSVVADQGRIHESLNTAYLLLSMMEAVSDRKLCQFHPAQQLAAHGVAWLDSGTPLPADFPQAYQASPLPALTDGYSWWQLQHGGVLPEDADPDRDQLTNISEYAFGGNPNASTPSPISVGTAAGNLTVTFSARVGSFVGLKGVDHTVGDLRYILEVSPDLVTWNHGPGESVLISASADLTGYEKLSVKVPGGSSRRFVRVRAELQR